MPFHVYIITNKKNGTLYIGMTRDLLSRIYQHKQKATRSFSNKYNLDKLVYAEEHDNPNNVIAREKQLKNWKRDWKIDLIESINPEWIDLYDSLR